MKKFAISAVFGLGMLAATAAPAVATPGLEYTGLWFHTKAACEKYWTDSHGGPQNPTGPHQCRHHQAGHWELWA